MANIKDLTVLSTDGASELVRNGTRTVAEASAVVKGVTGIDIPSLIGGAMGGRSGGEGSPGGGSGRGRGGSGGGGGAASSRSRSPKPAAPAASPAAGSEAAATPAWGQPPARSATPPPATPPPATTMDAAQEAMSRADAAMRRASEATTAAAKAPAPTAAARPANAPIGRDTTVNAAAQRLARDLSAIPGIERFGALRLGELDRAGPRPLRTMWRIAREQLGERYGEMTIGEVLDRYGRGGSPGAQA
jgi:flotillin